MHSLCAFSNNLNVSGQFGRSPIIEMTKTAQKLGLGSETVPAWLI